MTSSPMRPGATLEQELDYYKKQYEQLETDLADFQASSKELEEQLERDIEAAEKNERKLKAQVEKLGFEVEEWKTKHKQAKGEANSAQNALQKEITTLRESNRALQLKLRDVEVVNDDYERQARNTESSLEDLESKYNVTIERGVMQEEEIKTGEQEREALRIETQRLRDELGDLKVESEITLEKLRLADGTIERLRTRKPSPLAVESLRTRSPASEASGITPSSTTPSTPPPKSDTLSDAPTPPSPPLSDAPVHAKAESYKPRRSLLPDAAVTPRASLYGPRAVPRHTRGPSMASSNGTSASDARAMRPPTSKPVKVSSTTTGEDLPRSDSLYQIKALRGRMQKIEERVHSARSKLPPPGTRTPTGSPRPAGEHLPASVTMRRSMKRPSGSGVSSVATSNDVAADSAAPAPTAERTARRESHIKRLSYSIPRPTSSSAADRSPSALDNKRPPSSHGRPPSAAASSRPSSRASLASTPGGIGMSRPESRSGARTPAGHRSSIGGIGAGLASTSSSRPRSSMGGANYATIHGTTPRSHRPSASVSELRRKAATDSDEPAFAAGGLFSSPSRRTTLERSGGGIGLSAFGGGTAPRQPGKTLRRTSAGLGGEGGGGGGVGGGQMRPPPSRRKMSDVGETY
ncbi:NADH:ubiquinone oxidoreductase [Friedmanniomyces endolithicus]|uniref:NADH:ubiquinone oxidoreductase n=1 Tax=Friedmanniomyces endolithicus TaxID=329885 RepID=A0AAN6QU37_9PEZI|nr:NADH:ubiquinone oxidoreductase [Friedmanniomyces endolithicus]KAK0364726.1 NADH:ubiquinone oxidoreductase [Friedmanniomyces endolithicus]KAK0778327.1 NADH:ubiquinone oxidoreductase [Friedmanniomyces endolithicus]KAK0785404.1 NADH:ubiquinone oxidoreductase [Friedmanniomyces endolithicus]KAK0786745.1 NADH:ubiquinone oxidoreductase [Friedmanniomyces endolithicus]